MNKPTDYLGNEIEAGDVIHHAVRNGNVAELATSRVVEVLDNGTLHTKRIDDTSNRKWTGHIVTLRRVIVDLGLRPQSQ